MKLLEQKTIVQVEAGCYKIAINTGRPLCLALSLRGQPFRPAPFRGYSQSLAISEGILMLRVRLSKIASVLRIESAGVGLLLALALSHAAIAVDPPKSAEDLKREAAIVEFTRKMKEANYPAF